MGGSLPLEAAEPGTSSSVPGYRPLPAETTGLMRSSPSGRSGGYDDFGSDLAPEQADVAHAGEAYPGLLPYAQEEEEVPENFGSDLAPQDMQEKYPEEAYPGLRTQKTEDGFGSDLAPEEQEDKYPEEAYPGLKRRRPQQTEVDLAAKEEVDAYGEEPFNPGEVDASKTLKTLDESTDADDAYSNDDGDSLEDDRDSEDRGFATEEVDPSGTLEHSEESRDETREGRGDSEDLSSEEEAERQEERDEEQRREQEEREDAEDKRRERLARVRRIDDDVDEDDDVPVIEATAEADKEQVIRQDAIQAKRSRAQDEDDQEDNKGDRQNDDAADDTDQDVKKPPIRGFDPAKMLLPFAEEEKEEQESKEETTGEAVGRAIDDVSREMQEKQFDDSTAGEVQNEIQNEVQSPEASDGPPALAEGQESEASAPEQKGSLEAEALREKLKAAEARAAAAEAEAKRLAHARAQHARGAAPPLEAAGDKQVSGCRWCEENDAGCEQVWCANNCRAQCESLKAKNIFGRSVSRTQAHEVAAAPQTSGCKWCTENDKGCQQIWCSKNCPRQCGPGAIEGGAQQPMLPVTGADLADPDALADPDSLEGAERIGSAPGPPRDPAMGSL